MRRSRLGGIRQTALVALMAIIERAPALLAVTLAAAMWALAIGIALRTTFGG
ncbi:hypothetical protein QE374_002000 [Microbacterium sp. SORGH_AS428]|uniref:hypothetical protein n=1 Tax=Microbacterium sp. SORGH_AS_0428 TaxID=3041788 RepID=UPI0028555E5B|nr:hypothetical protein [Microbacterium sp. SORGH_AS_0428]MDR6200091.1 hypothetical protein [Microbacterium sp. SORGH_AS_0428]